jgi:Zn finger protein HypA/HybF involved in hydrogenase expression
MQHAKQYRARNGALQYKPAQGLLIDLIESGEPQGFCLACAEVIDEIEPDARATDCPNCAAAKVYGAEELLLMGLYFDEDREADIQHARAQGFIK